MYFNQNDVLFQKLTKLLGYLNLTKHCVEMKCENIKNSMKVNVKTKLIIISCWHHLLQFCAMTSQVNLLRGNLSVFWIVRSFVEREIDFPHKKKRKNYSQSSLSVYIGSCFVVQEICFPQNIMHLRIRMHFSCMGTSFCWAGTYLHGHTQNVVLVIRSLVGSGADVAVYGDGIRR